MLIFHKDKIFKLKNKQSFTNVFLNWFRMDLALALYLQALLP
jgi:hypothetical protein